MEHHIRLTMLLCLVTLAACNCADPGLHAVDFSDVSIDDSFWNPVLQRHKDVTIPVCIAQIKDSTFRLQNFKEAARLLDDGSDETYPPVHRGYFFDDSDVYKAVEGFAFSLQLHPDPALEALCDEWIACFASAQEKDGYINTYFTLKRPDDKWTDMDRHEMYCAGHLLEAGVAYFRATGKRSLLDIGQKMADHMMTVFGPEGRHWVPGHEEIELALVKLFKVTGERKYLDFAHWLLEERGHGYGTKDTRSGKEWNAKYYQDFFPVAELSDVTGHAVRAMYLYSGMADVQELKPEAGYDAALDALWEDVVLRNMYITGGIGSTRVGEAFTEDYDLPNAEAYCETCASIGMAFWNSRMNLLRRDARYADVVEKEIFNGILAGISLSGDYFFYVNPLESAGTHHRKRWYGCACCPSNLCRFLPSLGGYIYASAGKELYVNQYIGSTVSEKGRPLMSQSGGYPWDGNVRLEMLKGSKRTLRLRVPGWCRSWTLSLNGKALEPPVENGYAVLERRWKKGDVLVLVLDMPVELTAADPRVKADEGKRAVCRGPLVYCAEEVDNPSFDSLHLQDGMEFSLSLIPDGPLAGFTALDASGYRWIPYFAWDNRQAGRMAVWNDYNL